MHILDTKKSSKCRKNVLTKHPARSKKPGTICDLQKLLWCVKALWKASCIRAAGVERRAKTETQGLRFGGIQANHDKLIIVLHVRNLAYAFQKETITLSTVSYRINLSSWASDYRTVCARSTISINITNCWLSARWIRHFITISTPT